MKHFTTLGSLFLAALAAPTLHAQVVINELRIDHSGTDSEEFFELKGEPGTDLTGLTYIVIGDGNSTTKSGVIEAVISLAGKTIPADGIFLAATNVFGTQATAATIWGPSGSSPVTPDMVTGANNLFENSNNVTHLLVSGFSGSNGQDLDTNDDGVLETTPWTSIESSIGLFVSATDNKLYGNLFLGPDGTFLPGSAQRNADGGYSVILFGDYASNTPGAENLPATSTSYAENPTATVVTIPEVTIMQIQGSGYATSYSAQNVKTTGVVTLITADGNSFWMQDPTGDGNPATSDGLYVYRGRSVNSAVKVGDRVEVTATITEYYNLTETNQPSAVTVLSSNNPLPAPVAIADGDNADIDARSAYLETLEGMRVSLPLGYVVSPTNNFGEFVVVNRNDLRTGSGYNPQYKVLLVNSTGNGVVDYNPERIMIDDLARAAVNVTPGDSITNLVGVMDYTFSDYKVVYDSMTVNARPIPTGNVARRSRDSGPWNFKFGTFNVENLFDLIDEPGKDDAEFTPSNPSEEVTLGAALETKLSKLTLGIVNEMQTPDIITIEETENTAILQVLADRVNAMAGTNYVAISGGSSDGRGIECGLLYNANKVTLLNSFLLTEAIQPGVEAAFGPSSASAGREPFVGIFQVGTEQVTMIANHFKSKGGDGALWGTGVTPVRDSETQRKLQAQVLRDYLNTLFTANPNANIVIGGDLNDFQFPEPGEGLDPVTILKNGASGDTALISLIERMPKQDQFTYNYGGNAQVLDHMLISPALLDNLRGQDVLHINSIWPGNLEAIGTSALRSSDHDPLEARFWFNE